MTSKCVINFHTYFCALIKELKYQKGNRKKSAVLFILKMFHSFSKYYHLIWFSFLNFQLFFKVTVTVIKQN